MRSLLVIGSNLAIIWFPVVVGMLILYGWTAGLIALLVWIPIGRLDLAACQRLARVCPYKKCHRLIDLPAANVPHFCQCDHAAYQLSTAADWADSRVELRFATAAKARIPCDYLVDRSWLIDPTEKGSPVIAWVWYAPNTFLDHLCGSAVLEE